MTLISRAITQINLWCHSRKTCLQNPLLGNGNPVLNKIRFLLLVSLLIVFLNLIFFENGFAAEKVSFESDDGVQLIGEFYKPSSPQKFTLLLLHGLASVKEEWTPFAQFLNSKGYGVLIYDARGHGGSKKKKSGGSVDFHMFFGRGLSSDWGKMIEDLGSAVRFLRNKYKLDTKFIGVGGASLGANVALRFAAKNPATPFAVLLSPGIDYQGIATHDVMEKMVSRPVLLAASPGDRYAYQSVKELERIAGTKAKCTILIENENQGHGVQMFKRKKPNEPSPLEVRIVQWLEKIK